MTRKHANDPIPQIVDLGDGRYEFCYNHTTEQKEEHTDYIADYVVCDMPVARNVARKGISGNLSIAAYWGWSKHCNSRNLIKKLLNENKFKKSA